MTTAEQKSAKLARNVHWLVLYQICVFGADLKSNMAARVHNVFSLAEILKIFLSETTKSINQIIIIKKITQCDAIKVIHFCSVHL
jgi:hypothetical protein